MTTCSHCGTTLPADAAFCHACGRPTGAPPRDVPIDVQHAEPTYFGLGPPLFVLAVAGALIVLGVVFLLAGNVAVAVLALVLGVCLLPAFLAGARRWPDHPVSRLGITTVDRVRDEADVAVDSLSAWSRAGRATVRLRREQFALRRERDARIRELGASYYADDGRAETLKAEAKELDERLAAGERELARALAEARRRVRKGRAAVASTEVIRPGPEPEPSVPEQERATEITPGDGSLADARDGEADAVDVERRA